ncbi:hypothetical protein ACF1BE_29075 [Streptomyces sp. NPDC014991]|uniref:hypothetical protein n=1 Tax=Streptomyces sp. NPDC014991 TaxID=3364935 RepID=UPI0036F9E0A4
MHGVDYVVGNPTHTGRQPLQHIEAIMDAASTEDVTRAFPLSTPGGHRLVKHAETPRSANRTLEEKRAAAAAHAAALTSPETLATSRGQPSSSSRMSSPADRSFSTSRAGAARPVLPTFGDLFSQESPGADDLTVASGPVGSVRCRGAGERDRVSAGTVASAGYGDHQDTGYMLQRHAGQASVATAIITHAVMTQLRGPAAGIAVGVAAAAGGLWAAQGRARQKSAVATGGGTGADLAAPRGP